MTASHSISSGCAALADEIDAALKRALNAQEGGQERGNAEEALRRILWDNKAGIIAYLRTPALPFARWADTIEAASLTIGPARSKELDALAAEVRGCGAAQRPPDYSAWLIETDELASINYFQMVDDDDWTFDHNKAMHFGRKEDADKMIAYYGWTRARAVEHMWPEASSVPSTHQNTPTTHDQQEK